MGHIGASGLAQKSIAVPTLQDAPETESIHLFMI